MSTRTYIVATRYPQGTPEVGYSWETNSDMRELTTVSAAKHHGFRTVGSDDFNIAVLDGRTLVDWLWMNESVGESPETLADIAEDLGLRVLP